ncbi:MXAN_5187 family protein [Paraliomyxa miuraensis]|uniref:MXAN_5187 family protein n=1 Tax=Paraliomyxa miuraensis TaxID=376150 RepID=UPI0022564969|nr:MXAN_5187 family protein [Paraliomyxa miuraensis]MCX4241897.1 hypothetical protein [Paraliomyxa miuraensis]
MPLTRAWAIILAFLATACLAGMFLLSGSSGGGFTDADKAAVRAVTEAGVAALQAQLQASPVQQVGSLRQDSRLKDALTAERDPDDPDAYEANIYDALAEVAEETRVSTSSNMTVALVDDKGTVVAASGIVEKELPELIASVPFQEAPTDADVLFSIALADKLHVAKVIRPDAEGRRLLAVESLETGAGSLLRRVLGTETPAALVRKGQMLGDIIGDQPVSEELIRLAKDHHSEAPEVGASKVFTVGEGIGARIGSLGRIPGPAGKGDDGALLVVISARTAAAGQHDLSQALAQAREQGVELPLPLLIGLLLVTVGLAFYLPGLEGLTPMRRLSREFTAIAQGTQHSIFHDRYGGTAGEVARAAAAAHEALRQAYLAELEIEEDEDGEESSDMRTRPRTSRGRRLTRSHRSTTEGGRPGSRSNRTLNSPEREPEPEPEEAEPEESEPDELEAEPEPIRAPEPTRSRTPSRPAPPVGTPGPASTPAAPAAADPREAYYRSVYDQFVRVKTQCGEPTDKLTFEKFAQKLAKNTSDLKKKKPDIDDVQFTVYVKDGKAALKAKVVKA